MTPVIPTSSGVDLRWNNVGFNASDFTGGSSMIWTVEASDVITFKYMIVGKMMVLIITIRGSEIGGTPSASLVIRIPSGFRARGETSVLGDGLDNAVGVACFILVLSGQSIFVGKHPVADNWVATSNGCGCSFVVMFEIE